MTTHIYSLELLGMADVVSGLADKDISQTAGI